jgi:peptide deformylase
MAAKGERIVKYVNGNMLDYTIYELVDPYDKVLWAKTEPFDFNRPPMLPRQLATSLLHTMGKYGGIGLSANQVGFPYRVFVMGHGTTFYCCFNPEIVESVGEFNKYSEGCLSYPGLFLKVKRATKVKLRWTDENGQQKEETFDGFTARIIQHEMEHLDGTCFTKKVSPVKLQQAKDKVRIQKRRARDAEKLERMAQKA